MKSATHSISVVVPTYRREKVLLDTIDYLARLDPGAAEILIIDQTEEHSSETASGLGELENAGQVRWLRLAEPSIPHAMNAGLQEARSEIVLFLDDDIVPGPDLIAAHAHAHSEGNNIVAGQVLQPGETPTSEEESAREFLFRSNRGQYITELMGGNFSVKRELALKLGGFDENFVHVAYRFEAEFAERALAVGEKIWFEPQASVRHLKAGSGGTRSYGHHLRSIRPSHSVGAYYFLLRSRETPNRVLKLLARPMRAIRTRHHLSHPWWIPPTLLAEATGFFWAVGLFLRGPRLMGAKGKEQRAKGKEPSAKSKGQRAKG